MKQSGNKVEDFEEGQTVVYVDKGRQDHRTLDDCEPGRVKSKSTNYVFVQFMDKEGNYTESSQACDPGDLWFRI